MRCEDCLPLIEEYFDGEVTAQTGASVRAHLSACATCAAALDALSFEQEIYARYDRGGLEVTPDLWARVSAEIARTPLPESPAADRPFLSRAREYFAVALGALALRPALASSLALLIVAATVGTLRLSRRQRPNIPAPEMARLNTPTPVVPLTPTVPDKGGNETLTATSSLPFNEGESVPTAYEPREGARESATAQREPRGADISVDELLADSSATKANPNIVVIRPDEHNGTDDTAALFVNASAPGREVASADTQLLDPEEKNVARHVERAQMLLRSMKNARPSELGAADIAYEKNLSRKLLDENATLQLEAEVKGDRQSQQVLNQIAPFLLDIANLGDKPSREEVRSIRERVRQNEIVAALEVY